MTNPQTPAAAPPVAAAGTNPRRARLAGNAGSGPCLVSDASAGSAKGSARTTPVEADLPATGITFGHGHTHPFGPRCRNCQTTEAHCARDEGCCDGCTHFGPRLLCRMPGQDCGSERGFQRHRTDKTSACLPCRAAHVRHNRRQQQ